MNKCLLVVPDTIYIFTFGSEKLEIVLGGKLEE
jgi:hypothetical protein